MYTIKQLKKMATEKLSRIFEAVYGYTVFNPYTEREYMIVSLAGHYQMELSNAYVDSGDYEFEVTFSETKQVKDTIYNDEFSELFGEDYFETKQKAVVNAKITGSKTIDKIFAAINNTWLPVRVETKGRKSRFSYRDVWDMLYADIQGMRLSEIAKYFETSSVIVLQILTGKSYQWASGISELSFE